MKLLVIGGTVFVGRHLTAAALEDGHDVTLFNRGQHNPELFPEAHHVSGDRATDISRLEGRWDVVVDTCGYFPRDVAVSAGHLRDKTGLYVFVSSLSVYSDAFTTPGVDESGRLLTTDPDATEVTVENYGGLKALCEQAAEDCMPGRVLIVRPGLIVGPYDQSDRFTYWAERLTRGGDILAPGPPEDPVQLVDVADLAGFMLRLAIDGRTGAFNVTGPEYELSMKRCLEAGLTVAGSNGRLVWVDGEWLRDQDVRPWVEIPLWMPEAVGFARFDCSKAIEAGLTFRSIPETFRATQEWLTTRPADHDWRAGLAGEKEKQLLGSWADAG